MSVTGRESQYEAALYEIKRVALAEGDDAPAIVRRLYAIADGGLRSAPPATRDALACPHGIAGGYCDDCGKCIRYDRSCCTCQISRKEPRMNEDLVEQAFAVANAMPDGIEPRGLILRLATALESAAPPAVVQQLRCEADLTPVVRCRECGKELPRAALREGNAS